MYVKYAKYILNITKNGKYNKYIVNTKRNVFSFSELTC